MLNIEVITGGMFCGKTTLLQKKIREAQKVEYFKTYVFKPSTDNRYSESSVVSHDGVEEDAIAVRHGMQIVHYVMQDELVSPEHKKVVFIDEAQFFDKILENVIQRLVILGCDVVIAGLDLDSNGRPFGGMPSAIAMATKIHKLTARCKCGNESYVTTNKNKKGIVQVGNEGYEPTCIKCFYNN
ncbi:AAA family ATPase [Priestia endophytica]|uniref:thymidine kinase n=1 Tax=Priestia endophytica TaxID=135735 RepID=UPI003D2CCFF0